MSEGRVPPSVSVIVAHELLQAGHSYLDVRTTEEFSQGHACGAINVPYMNRGFLWMSKNPNFLEQVSSHFGQPDKIIVGCQSGGRSLKATTELFHAGFTGVTDVSGGYAAWIEHGLPTERRRNHNRATIQRLWDDLGSAKDENQDGIDGSYSYIECYLNEHKGSTVDEARANVFQKISKAWKCLNRDCLNPRPFSRAFANACLNITRTVPLMYNYDDDRRLPGLDEYLKSLV